jgi:hypothetical protein
LLRMAIFYRVFYRWPVEDDPSTGSAQRRSAGQDILEFKDVGDLRAANPKVKKQPAATTPCSEPPMGMG